MLKIDCLRAGLIAFAMMLVGVVVPIGPSAAARTRPAGAPERAPASAQPDFNGDGFADLAVAGEKYMKGDDLPTGTISIIYGSALG